MSPNAVADQLTVAAAAAVDRLPASSPLSLGTPAATVGPDQLPADAATALSARLTGTVTGEVVVVVERELVDALRSSPLGPLDVAAAVQPVLDAAAESLGQVVADAAVELPVEVALDGLAEKGLVHAVPLVTATGAVAATLVFAVTPAAVPRQRTTMPARAGLELLRNVEMEVTAELGRTRMTVRELLSLAPGAVIELDRAAGSPADLLVNGTLIARGEVVVVDENFGIRITEIVSGSAESGAA